MLDREQAVLAWDGDVVRVVDRELGAMSRVGRVTSGNSAAWTGATEDQEEQKRPEYMWLNMTIPFGRAISIITSGAADVPVCPKLDDWRRELVQGAGYHQQSFEGTEIS